MRHVLSPVSPSICITNISSLFFIKLFIWETLEILLGIISLLIFPVIRIFSYSRDMVSFRSSTRFGRTDGFPSFCILLEQFLAPKQGRDVIAIVFRSIWKETEICILAVNPPVATLGLVQLIGLKIHYEERVSILQLYIFKPLHNTQFVWSKSKL